MTEIPQILQAAILGLMQGLAEFLPISSSAHLVIIPEILGWPYLGKAFDVALHFGTLMALVVVFKADVLAILRGTRNMVLGKFMSFDDNRPEETRLVQLLVVGCIPAAVIGLKFEDVSKRSSVDSTLWPRCSSLGVSFFNWPTERKPWPSVPYPT